ncbi:hypothetical protein M405DRAFT_822137 [Rhizopogon salebrosus TDB-379]|nr:hypothetical protein M405DRAFT_822137 [Rhizopogon salebrosus TDB-379]
MRDIKKKPNTYLIMIVRYHIIYFVSNLANQILMTISWTHAPTRVLQLSAFFSHTAPFILVPRFVISIWDTHAHEECVHVSTTFADCLCWTSPPAPDSEEQEIAPNPGYESNVLCTLPIRKHIDSVSRYFKRSAGGSICALPRN